MEFSLNDYSYDLAPNFIAQTPLKDRDQSKLMVLTRKGEKMAHHHFYDLPKLLPKNAVLVFNESRVLPARLKLPWGNGQVEILLLKPRPDVAEDTWECLVRPGDKFIEGAVHKPYTNFRFEVKAVLPSGIRVIQFFCDNLKTYLERHGQMPTPPYIKEKLEDPERYQTVYSKTEGSAAAPTAGLHFTPKLLEDLKKRGIATEFVTLHVGLGTFQPVKTEDIREHQIHSEWFSLSEETAARLNDYKREGRPIIAVGTTSVRVLETCSEKSGTLKAATGETQLFIYPGYTFKFVDQMITNFHVPKSSLLMLVSAFAGREFILKAYEEAKTEKYRFFSFGDAMWIH